MDRLDSVRPIYLDIGKAYPNYINVKDCYKPRNGMSRGMKIRCLHVRMIRIHERSLSVGVVDTKMHGMSREIRTE